MKFEGYRYLTPKGVEEIRHHCGKEAFQKFLKLAKEPRTLRVTIRGQEQTVAGSILVWGVVTDEGRAAAMAEYGFADVLGVEDMLGDLAEWRPKQWAEWIGTRQRWTDELFGWLAYPADSSPLKRDVTSSRGGQDVA